MMCIHVSMGKHGKPPVVGKKLDYWIGHGLKIDTEDYKRLHEYTYVLYDGYLMGTGDGGGRNTNQLARHILRLKTGCGEVDHINHDRLDNRKRNLRVVTHRQNMMNMRIRCDNHSGYKGVRYDYKKHKYESKIGSKHIGWYQCKEDAAIAFNTQARELYGEYACVNEIKRRNYNIVEIIRRCAFGGK